MDDLAPLPKQFIAWHRMMERCHRVSHPSYKDYGRRGIKVHSEWHDFMRFRKDLHEEIGEFPGEGYSMDRINNDKGYEPGNLRWATWREQSENKRERTPYNKPKDREAPQPRTIVCSVTMDNIEETVCRLGHIVFHAVTQ